MRFFRWEICCFISLVSLLHPLAAFAETAKGGLDGVYSRMAKEITDFSSKENIAKLTERANTAFAREQYEDALKLFDELLAAVSQSSDDQIMSEADQEYLVMTRAATLLKLARYPEATSFYSDVLEEVDKDNKHADRKLTALNALAEIETASGAFADAQNHIDQAFELIKKNNLKSAESVNTQLRQADLYFAMTKYLECQKSYEAALAKAKALGTLGKKVSLEAMIGLCLVNSSLFNMTVALELSDKTLAMSRTLYDFDSLELAAAMRARANIFKLDDSAETSKLLMQAESIHLKLLGRNAHPLHAQTMLDFALLSDLKPYSVGDNLCTTAQKMTDVIFSGKENPLQVSCMSVNGTTLSFQQKFKPAIELRLKAIALQQKLVGKRSLGEAQFLLMLANAYLGDYLKGKLDGYADAKKVVMANSAIREAVSIFEEKLGANSPRLAALNGTDGWLKELTEDYAGAVKINNEQLSVLRKTLSPGSHRLLLLYREILDDNMKLDNKDAAAEAGVALMNALLDRKSIYDPEVGRAVRDIARVDPRFLSIVQRMPAEVTGISSTMESISSLLENKSEESKFKAKLASTEKRLREEERRFGSDSPALSYLLLNKAGMLSSMNDYQAASAVYERIVNIMDNGLGPEHPTLIKPLCGYASLLEKMGKTTEAKAMEERSERIKAACTSK